MDFIIDRLLLRSDYPPIEFACLFRTARDQDLLYHYKTTRQWKAFANLV